MSKYSGYMDKVAKLDLGTGKAEAYPWSDKDKELYIGGRAMAAKLLFDNLSGKEEALGADNVIVITTGPLTGTGAPSSARFNIAAVSPETGKPVIFSCGGTFGYYLKKAGYDALVITGKCAEHSWVEIYNSDFILHDADSDGMWGKSADDSEEHIFECFERDYMCRLKHAAIVCEPAGEALEADSAVFSSGHAVAGAGAVFGAKNLKGISVTGNKRPAVKNEKKNTAWNKKWVSYLREHPLTSEEQPKLNAASLISGVQSDKLLAASCAEKLASQNGGCLSCPIKCNHNIELNGMNVNGPELESVCQLETVNGNYLALLADLGMNVGKLAVSVQAELTVLLQNIFEAVAATGECLFTGYGLIPAAMAGKKGAVNKLAGAASLAGFINKHPELLFFPVNTFYHDRSMKYATGMKMNLGKFIRCGERAFALEKYMDALFAADTAEDKPEKAEDAGFVKAYLAARGWSKEGKPTEASLKKLNIRKGSV